MIIWVPAASQGVAGFALGRWDAAIPAEIEWQDMRGSLGAGLEIHELELRDGEGRPLIRSERLLIDLDVDRLLRLEGQLERVHARGLEVWIDHDWGALAGEAKPEDEPEDEPSEGVGPDLPVRVGAQVEIEALALYQSDEALVRNEGLVLALGGRGRSAWAELELRGTELPAQDQRVDSLALALAWEDPRATLEHLTLASPHGRLRTLEPARVDLEARSAELALELVLADELGPLAAQLELAELEELASSVVQLRARVHDAEASEGPSAELELSARVDPETHLSAKAEASLVRATGAGAATLHLDAALGAARLHPEQPALALKLDAELTRAEDQRLAATLGLDLTHADQRPLLHLDAGGEASSLSPPRGSAWLELRGPSLKLSADAASTEARELDAHAALVVEDLGAPLQLAAPFLGEPRLGQIQGALTLRASCASAPGEDLSTLSCPLSLQLDRAAAFDLRLAHAGLGGVLRPTAEPLAFDVALELAGLEHEKVELERASFEVAGTTRALALSGRGRGPKERFALDLDLDLDGPRKRVDLDELVLVSTRGGAPAAIELSAPAQILITPDQVDLRRVRARALGGTIALDGHLGLGGRSSDLRAQIHGVELTRVDPLVPGPRLAGTLSLDAGLRGRLEQPAAWVWLEAEGLALDLHQLGELRLAAKLCGPAGEPALLATQAPQLASCGPGSQGQLLLWLRDEGPIVDAVELQARVPLRLTGGFGLRPRAPLEGRLVVSDLDLVELGGLMPATPEVWQQVPPNSAAPPGDPRLIPEGRVDLELTVAGTTSKPELRLRAGARDLVIDRTALGSLTLTSSLDETGLALELDAPLSVATLELDAQLPLALDLARQRLDWDREAEHRVDLDLRELDFDELERILGPKLPALDQALAAAELGGRVSLALRARGNAAQPWLGAELHGEDLRHAEGQLGVLDLSLDLHAGLARAELTLVGPLAERLELRAQLPVNLELGASGLAPALAFDPEAKLGAELHVHAVELAALQEHLGPLPVSGRADLDLVLRGDLRDPKLELAARLAELRLGSQPAGDLTLLAQVGNERARLELDLMRRDTRLLDAALELPLLVDLAEPRDVQLGWRPEGVHALAVHVRSIDQELLAALLGLPEDEVPIEPQLRFDLEGSGTSSAFALRGGLDGHVRAESSEFEVHAELDLDPTHQRLALALEPEQLEPVKIVAQLDADVARLIAGEQQIPEVPFTLEAQIPAFDLSLLAPLVQPALHDPRGVLRASLSGEGVLGAPRLDGALALEDGAITVLALRQRLLDIDLDLRLDEELVELRALSLDAGRGYVRGEGQATIDPAGGGVEAALAFEVAKFPIVRPGVPAMAIDSQIDLDLSLAPAATRVHVALAKTEVEVSGLPASVPKSIPSSDAVVFVDASDAGVQAAAPSEDAKPGQDTPAEAPAQTGSELAVELELVDPLQITGSSIDMTWSGALGLQLSEAGIHSEGQLEARRGRLELLGHRFELARGLVSLPSDGSVDPFLDIIAETDTPTASVTVTIRGRASRPELHFSSTPPLDEYQILTLLVTGSTELGEDEGQVEAKAASLLAAVSSPQLQKQLDRYLGIDRARLGFGDSVDQPILTVGKRVSPKIWVETSYHHNAPEDHNTAEVGVEYNFVPHWSLETFFGDAAVGGVGVYWTHSFGPIHWRTPPRRRRGSGSDSDSDSEEP